MVICYALRSKDIFRFVTTADVDRWETDAQALHDVAIAKPEPACLAVQAGRRTESGTVDASS